MKQHREKNTFKIKKLRPDYIGKNRQHVDRKTIDFTKIIMSKLTKKPYMMCEIPIKSIDYRFEYRLVKDGHGFLYIIDEKLMTKAFDISDLESITRDPAKEALQIEAENLKLEAESEELLMLKDFDDE